jgi:hypothetical protein
MLGSRIAKSLASLLLAMLHVGSATADSTSSAAPPSGTGQRQVELLIQNVEGQGVRFAFPASYLAKFQREGGLETTIFLEIYFPDMRPPQPVQRTLQELVGEVFRDLDEAKGLKQESPEDKDREDTWFGGVRLMGATLDRIVQARDYDVSRYEQYADDSEPGFIHYRRDTGNSATAVDLLVPADQAATIAIWFECRPFSSCMARTLFGDRVHLSYNIGRQSIGQWRELDARVRLWLHDFVVDCFEGARLTAGNEPAQTHPCPF